MASFIMLTRLAHGALDDPKQLGALEQAVKRRIEAECPGVVWSASYAVLGPCDYLDIFEAPDTEAAMKVATIIRTFGHAETEIWAATEWQRFKQITQELTGA